MDLTSDNVEKIFTDCLFRENEVVNGNPPEGFVKSEAVQMTVGFHPERLKSHEAAIKDMLGHLPSEFQQGGGGGHSFLNACTTKTGRQWGEHRNVDQLLALGLASGLVAYCLPREAWKAFPGGMPYFVVKAAA